MSGKQDKYKMKTVADLEICALDVETKLGNANTKLLGHILRGFFELANLLDRKESGIYTAVLRWFRLYLRMQTSIDPKNSKLLQQFEKSIPTAISYIIGCLQYKTRDVTDYHYNLLEIMDSILQNCQPKVIKQFANFDSGTISCIWKPIGFVGDFNTQLLALKILAKFLKSLDIEKQEGEFKAIKWTNLNLFKDNLNRVIEKTQQIHAFESACRELLNNFNMNLSNKLLVYSFNCKTVIIANKYEFFKPLFSEKFWVDLNYCPRSISFNGRYKLSAKSSKFEDFNVILKWKIIKLEDDCLLITIDKTKTSHLPNNIISKLTNHDEMKIFLSHGEEQRIKKNEHLMGYLNSIGNENNIEDYTGPANISLGILPKSVDTKHLNNSSTTPSTSRNNENTTYKQQYSLRQQSRKRKFFGFLESDADDSPTNQPNKESKKKKIAVKKPRILKPRNNRKSVCKVVPLVDLTKSPEKSEKKKCILEPNVEEITNVENALHNDNVNKSNIEDIQLNEKQCNTILERVSAICYKGEVYDHFQSESDAEPCQSYRNYKSSRMNCPPNGSKNGQTEIFRKCTSKVQNTGDNVDMAITEINNAKELSICKRIKRKIASQDLFDNIKSDETFAPDTKRRMLPKDIDTKINTIVDLTLDHNILSDGGCLTDCEEMRLNDYTAKVSTPIFSPNSIPKTPTSTTTMNISDINDTPSVSISDHFLLKDHRTEGEIAFRIPFGSQELNTNETVEHIINDWQVLDYDQKADDAGTERNINLNVDNPNMRDCVIYQKRIDSDVSDSDSDSVVDMPKQLSCHDVLHLNSLETSVKQIDLPATSNVISPRLLETAFVGETSLTSRDEKNIVVTNVTATSKTNAECQVTPSIIIMSRTQVNTTETVIISDSRSKLINRNVNTRKRFFELYNNEDQNKCIQRISSDQDLQRDIVPYKRCKIEPNIYKNAIQQNSIPDLPNRGKTTVAEMLRANKENLNLESAPKGRGEGATSPKKYGISFKKTAKDSSCRINFPLNTMSSFTRSTSKCLFSNILTLNSNKNTTSIVNNNFNINGNCNTEPGTMIIDKSNNEVSNEVLRTNCEIQENNDLLENVEDTHNTVGDNGADSHVFENEELLKNGILFAEVSHLIHEYNGKVQTTMDNLRRKRLSNSFDEIKQKVCHITESILRQSKEQRRELERIQLNMERLMRQMECQYQIYVKRTKEYESFQENTERTLDALGRFNLETGITNEYKDLINQFTAAEKVVRQEVWQNYLRTQKRDILNEIETLSEI